MSSYETILVEISDDKVATVTLNRPEVLNCFNEAMRADFSRLWADLGANDQVNAVVLTAAGDRAFSTGLDVTERTGGSDSPWLNQAGPWSESEDPGHDLSPKRNKFWKPVVAAVRGMCAGGAFYWIAECDIVLCSPEATFFDPHVTYGLVAALEPIALSYRMHASDVLRMALLGLHERMTAERALQCGLVTEVVDSERLLDRAHELAAAIASQPPAAVQGTVKAIWRSFDLARGQAMDSALMYTQIGNPLGTAGLDWDAARPSTTWGRGPCPPRGLIPLPDCSPTCRWPSTGTRSGRACRTARASRNSGRARRPSMRRSCSEDSPSPDCCGPRTGNAMAGPWR